MAPTSTPSNFTHLRAHDEQLVRLGQLAERYFPEDPNTCLLKLRQLVTAVNAEVTRLYWTVGQRLAEEFGRGFESKNLRRMTFLG